MESNYDQLTQLKKLLDSGYLTQEEFEAAKNRILTKEGSTQTPNTSQIPPVPNDIKRPSPLSKFASKKWILWGLGGVLVLIILLIVVSNRVDNSKISTYENSGLEVSKAEADAQLEKTLALAAEINEDDGLTIGNPWRKKFIHNEWGEDISPFISATLDGTSWDIRIDYLPANSECPNGLFRFGILNNDGYPTNSYGPVEILVRGADGETKAVEVTGTQGGVTFIEDPATVVALKYYFDQESFDIRMDFDKWNERHSTRARWDCTPGLFKEAIETLL